MGGRAPQRPVRIVAAGVEHQGSQPRAAAFQVVDETGGGLSLVLDGGGGARREIDRNMEGTNVILLDADVAAVFHDSKSVNQALRVIIKATEHFRSD